MKIIFATLVILTFCLPLNVIAQNITYSEVEKADSRNLSFEILGKFSDNYLIYKNINRTHKITVFDSRMVIKDNIKLNFISDKTTNIDFITYPNKILLIWQYQKGNTTYCKAAKLNELGILQGTVLDLDTTKASIFSNNTYYNLTWSEDKKRILIYKTQTKNDNLNLVTKIYDENLLLLDSTRHMLEYNNNRESYGDLLLDNDGNIIFSKQKENARQEYINTIDINIKKYKVDSLISINLPLDNRLVQEPVLKVDNLNNRYVINSFSYKKNGGNVDGMFTAIVSKNPFSIIKQTINVFDDSLRTKLSGRPDWRTAYDDYFLKNIILKRDGGFIVVTEEYSKQRRFGGNFDDRYNSALYGGRYYGSASDYYYFNRGYSGYYRPFNETNNRDIVYNYNDIIMYSFTKDVQLQWNNVINKTTSDVETDNFLSFANMNAGAEIHFLFLQKDNNKQILSNHALQPNGSIMRYATLKSREAGYNFMPRLARQTGAKQMIVPCIVRNNIAFAKIDF